VTNHSERMLRELAEMRKLDALVRSYAGATKLGELFANGGRYDDFARTNMKLAAIGLETDRLYLKSGGVVESELRRQMELLAEQDKTRSLMKMAAITHFTSPEKAQIYDLVTKMAPLTCTYERLAMFTDPADSLARKLGLIHQPWAFADAPELSVDGFAHLSRLGNLIQADPPYAPETREIVEEEFGAAIEDAGDEDPKAHEARYDAAGRNPAIVAFPLTSYPDVVLAAGIELHIPPPATPVPIENAQVVTFDVPTHPTLRALELYLRAFIVEQLSKSNPRWVRQKVPHGLRQEWADRQQADRDLGRPVFDLIHYSDLGHLEQILLEGANWRETFQPFFRDPAPVITSFRRLTPIRNACAHQRPLTQSDHLIMTAEALCLLRAIGIVTPVH